MNSCSTSGFGSGEEARLYSGSLLSPPSRLKLIDEGRDPLTLICVPNLFTSASAEPVTEVGDTPVKMNGSTDSPFRPSADDQTGSVDTCLPVTTYFSVAPVVSS